ncbi:MAG: KaiC domain-containing protein [Thermoplasmata archaeon]|nr:KaiC domain-containing protein [Thermoplasmata archaeon]
MTEEKLSTGVAGLDEMLSGGIPKGHIAVVMGAFGTGKTTLALQFINQGLSDGENCIFISLEEDTKSILRSAEAFGWDLQKYFDENKLGLFKLEPADAKSTISRIRSELPSFIKQFKASRVVLDSVSLLNMLFDREQERRTALFNLTQLLRSTGCTSLLTAEVKDDNPRSSRDGLVEYTVDGVILLQYDEPRESGEGSLSVRILKMRRIAHSRRIRPYSIGKNGITVHSHAEAL